MTPGIYVLENGLLGYGAGQGHVGDDASDRCLILSIEVDDIGQEWVHIVRLRHAERLPSSQVKHWRQLEMKES